MPKFLRLDVDCIVKVSDLQALYLEQPEDSSGWRVRAQILNAPGDDLIGKHFRTKKEGVAELDRLQALLAGLYKKPETRQRVLSELDDLISTSGETENEGIREDDESGTRGRGREDLQDSALPF